MKNYYAILEVPVGSSAEEIRQAYRRLAQENLDNAEAFGELKEAYEVLATPARRTDYDLTLWGAAAAPIGASNTRLLVALPGAEQIGRCPMGAESHCPVLQMRVDPSDKFCPECGFLLASLGGDPYDLKAQAPSETQIQLVEANGRIHSLHLGSCLAGRESADILLPDKTVSRQHARLEIVSVADVTIEDLSSTNGTQVNDQMLVPHLPRRLADGDRIRFGSILTTLHLPEAETAPAPELTETPPEEIPAPPSLPPQAKLVETREIGPEDAAPREFLLPAGMTSFGRRPENTVVLLGDPYVSGSHAHVIADGDVFRLTDLGSTNGTLVNGERLAANAPIVLAFGDLVVIGGTALRFERIFAEEVSEDAAGDEAQPSADKQEFPTPVEG